MTEETAEPTGPSRRGVLAGVAIAGIGAVASGAMSEPAAADEGGPEPGPAELKLTKFKDPLRIPPVLRPRGGGGHDELTVKMRTAEVRVHSELPPVKMWTYEGTYPGPTIETNRGRPLRVTWENRLTGAIPVAAVDYNETVPGQDLDPLTNYPGRARCQEVPGVAALSPWTAVHLHGMFTGGGNDGWMENLLKPGEVQLSAYPNDQAAMTMWYHDHTHHVTRFSVYAGLTGMFISRNEEEKALDLPKGDHEIPLILSDRNFDLDGAGNLTGQLLHKIEMVSPRKIMRPFSGPYTLVNGVIWPYLKVEPRWYRFRMANLSNARVYRLVLFGADKQTVPGALKVIGTDQGLLDKPVAVEGPLLLSPGERADVLIDFSAFRGQAVKLINTRPEVPHGQPDKSNDMLEPDVMQFRVADRRPSDRFQLPAKLSPTFKRITHDDVPDDHGHRWIMLTSPGAPRVAEMWEMEEVDPAGLAFPTDGIIQVKDAGGKTTTLRRTAADYHDGAAFMPKLDGWEIWKILNLGGPPHPIHVHLVGFHVLARETYDVSGWDKKKRGSSKPIGHLRPAAIEPHETGEKDVIRVAGHQGTEGELVTIAVKFGAAGRGVYHCHSLEHENHMMRPFVVTPAEHMPGGGHH